MLTTPVLKRINPFDKGQDYMFGFGYQGSNQTNKNNLIIEKVSDNQVVYNQTQTTFSLRHVLPADTLVNGINYRAKIRVGDINNNWSQFSEYIFFWVLQSPVLEITTIDYNNQNRVYNQTVNFETTYSQANSEALQSYRYLLYDNNQDLMVSFPEKFANGSLPLTQEITGLGNGVLYYLEVKTQSVNGQQGSTGLINFKPFYITPKLLSTLVVENAPEQGALKLNADILQLFLKLYDGNGNEVNQFDIDYIDNDWIDMNRTDYAKLVTSEGFKIEQSNFTLQIWCKNIPENEVFLTLFSNNGKIKLSMYGNKIHAFKSIYGSSLLGHFASEEIVIDSNDVVSIIIRQVDELIDVYAETVQGGG